LRKAALTCLETVFDSDSLPVGECIDMKTFMPHLVAVLADKDEVKLQAHQILIKLCAYAPGSVLAAADTLIEPIEKTVTKKASKEGVVGPEVRKEITPYSVLEI
jgi:cullin-associated NEDD8-dissociated protein 1